jgi:DNA repair protein RecO (recombination protein O)
MLVTTDAIVLRSRKQGDTSKICALYTKEYGLVDVIAKGAREMKSKFAGSLELFMHVTAVFYKKQGKELYLLSKSGSHHRSPR